MLFKFYVIRMFTFVTRHFILPLGISPLFLPPPAVPTPPLAYACTRFPKVTATGCKRPVRPLNKLMYILALNKVFVSPYSTTCCFIYLLTAPPTRKLSTRVD